jgi:hypothetical protein
MVSKENLSKVSKVCKNLEVLEIEYLNADKEFLEELGLNCLNLKSFHWSHRGPWSYSILYPKVYIFNLYIIICILYLILYSLIYKLIIYILM